MTLSVAAGQPDLTVHWVGFASLAIFAVAYALVISEEAIRLHKSKPVVVAAGVLWIMIAAVNASFGVSQEVGTALRHILLNMQSCSSSYSSR